MRDGWSIAAAAWIVCMLAACAAPASLELSRENQSELGRTDVVVVVAQDAINADPYRPVRGQGLTTIAGRYLISIPGPLLSSPGKIDISIEPYRAALASFDFRERATAMLERKLSSSTSFRTAGVYLERSPDKNGLQVPRQETAAGSTLLLELQYGMVDDYTAAYVGCKATLVSNPREGSPPRTVYYRTLTFSRGAPRGGGDLTQRWTAEEGAGLRKVLDADIADLAESLLKDLERPAQATTAQ